ncbi:MAG: hypothetical protein NDI69_15500 [Bacteriovoracaceae bacterium]|nr:hypothetical protein [Bacteriovoracaceae bacterium]
MWRWIHLLSLLTVVACNDVHINAAKSVGSVAAPTLIWNYTQPTIRAGESIPFAFSNGGTTFTTNDFGIGTFDPVTLVYGVPINLGPISHTISASDDLGNAGTNTIKIAGFQVGEKIDFPLSFGDQNFITSSASLANGTLFISSIASADAGWERWAVFRSTDYGQNWELSDFYVPFENGESHPLATVTKGNDIYVCGYMYDNDSPSYSSEWIVRKSSDNGATWTTADHFVEIASWGHQCMDIAVSASGNIYAAGLTSSGGGVIRESIDDGATWTTIHSVPAVSSFISIKVSPAGVIWAVSSNDGHLWKGTYALGSWNWSDLGSMLGGALLGSGAYELVGDLEIVSETEAYFSGNTTSWKIAKTIDGGTTWNTVYNGVANYTGQDIKKLSTGELVAIGSFFPGGFSKWFSRILRSTDDGVTWNVVHSDDTITQEGVTLIEANDGSIMGFGYYRNNPDQGINWRSTDSGATWSVRSVIHYKEQLYTGFEDLKKDPAGNLWATGSLMFIDSTYSYPWVVMKSADNGVTWTNSDVFTSAGISFTAESIGIGPTNTVYVGGINANTFDLRRTIDGGATWGSVDTQAFRLFNVKIATESDGTAYYFGNAGAGGGLADLRRGTSNGTSWSTVHTFPVEAGSTNFMVGDLKIFSDGSLWIAGVERDVALVWNRVMYRSTDDGATFTEILRAPDASSYKNLTMTSNGDVLAHTTDKVIRTSDNGLTWEDVYDGTLNSTMVKGFALDNQERIYVLDYDDKVWAQNQFNGSWFTMYDYSLINFFYGREIKSITDCGETSQVCLIGHYQKSSEGFVYQMIPLVIP